MPERQGDSTVVDVHQHLWPDELVDRLRARSRAPYLRRVSLSYADELRLLV